MTYYIIQTTHITDKGTTITRYYSESKYESPWTDNFGNAKFFKNYDDAKYSYNQWYRGESFENALGIHLELKKVDISIIEEDKEHNCHNCGYRSSFSFGGDYGCDDPFLFNNPCVDFNHWIPNKEDEGD